MIIGERAYKAISDRASENGLEVWEYAKNIGIDRRNVSNWKTGRSEPRAYSLCLMAEAGLDVHWILTGQRVDKVEVVRCKDCKYCFSDERGLWCFRDYEIDLKPDDFCSSGERRSDNAAD